MKFLVYVSDTYESEDEILNTVVQVENFDNKSDKKASIELSTILRLITNFCANKALMFE
jgi:hypothetical protein